MDGVADARPQTFARPAKLVSRSQLQLSAPKLWSVWKKSPSGLKFTMKWKWVCREGGGCPSRHASSPQHFPRPSPLITPFAPPPLLPPLRCQGFKVMRNRTERAMLSIGQRNVESLPTRLFETMRAG